MKHHCLVFIVTNNRKWINHRLQPESIKYFPIIFINVHWNIRVQSGAAH